MEQRVRWHLQHNHYPPIHEQWVEPCIKALSGDDEVEIPLSLYESTDERTITDGWRILEVFRFDDVH